MVLDVLAQDRAAVERRRRRASRARSCRPGGLRHQAHRVGGRRGRHDVRVRQRLAEEARALSGGLRVRDDRADGVEPERPRRRSRQKCTGCRSSPTIDQVLGLEHERVEHRVHRALERVLDRDQRAVDRPVAHGEHGRLERRLRNLVEVARSRVQRLVADRALRAEVADAHQSSVTVREGSPASASRIASSSSGESSCSPRPSAHHLQYSRALVAVGDAGEHDAVALGVEQGERRGLVAGHLAVGVVADERAVGDRAVEPLLGGRHPRVEPLGDLLDAPVQRLERGLQVAGVGDEVVTAAAAEHDGLGAAQAPQLDREHDREDERDQRHGAGGQRDEPDRIRQVVHDAESLRARQPRSNSAGYSERLLSVFSSPGTLATVVRIVRAAPSGGVVVERELDRRALLRRELRDGLGQRDRVAALAGDPHA